MQFNFKHNVAMWREITRFIKADSLEEAKEQLALYEPESCEYIDEDWLGDVDFSLDESENTARSECIKWEITDEAEHYPVVVLHQTIIFAMNGPSDLEDAPNGLPELYRDFVENIKGHPTKYIYVKPADFLAAKLSTTGEK